MNQHTHEVRSEHEHAARLRRLEGLRERGEHVRLERFLGERRLEMVPLTELPLEPLAPDAFIKVPYAEMRAGLERYRDTIAPRLARGEALNVEAWRELDAQQGLAPAHGHARVFSALFERLGDPIAVDRDGHGAVTVLNGRHRIHLARELGIEALPVRRLDRRSPR